MKHNAAGMSIYCSCSRGPRLDTVHVDGDGELCSKLPKAVVKAAKLIADDPPVIRYAPGAFCAVPVTEATAILIDAQRSHPRPGVQSEFPPTTAVVWGQRWRAHCQSCTTDHQVRTERLRAALDAGRTRFDLGIDA